MISDERLAEIAEDGFVQHGDSKEMARELLALRKAFSEPDCWEIAGNIFSTEEEALKPGFRGKPEPLFSKPDYLNGTT
ncbi:hypothetical protein QMZ65_03260 [Pantoea sp. EABMAA-21]|uniref:hypothetical protein n=1 Tax=Pantoea sp. EABMAA-21 TaxID=3043302 RepID=UPI0024B5B9E8|nr:hypothetical protein [Pantoea sp. EABMAA-21]MDI9276224.1 hypothetical protein [Pantoea sp. EABMAA-21]